VLLGGGSNVIFPDEGFEGIVIAIDIRGYRFHEIADGIVLDAAAGEEWDPLVSEAVARGLAGIECLSGIPGLVGATPMQNVGAYGQEVAGTIMSVDAIDLHSMQEVQFSNAECHFGYRQSRFKGADKDRFAITRVRFLLRPGGEPSLAYPELRKQIELRHQGSVDLGTVRQTVLALRKGKSMVLDKADPNARSVGSFFMNPVMSREFFDELRSKLSAEESLIPSFPGGANNVKIPAAWLVEHSGFRKGFRKGGVGISANHALALVNYGGTTKELLGLAEEIREAVKRKFSIMLQTEPSIVS
jgi:UDP-N-acetylmuramate dehydrogenase